VYKSYERARWDEQFKQFILFIVSDQYKIDTYHDFLNYFFAYASKNFKGMPAILLHALAQMESETLLNPAEKQIYMLLKSHINNVVLKQNNEAIREESILKNNQIAIEGELYNNRQLPEEVTKNESMKKRLIIMKEFIFVMLDW